MLSRQGVRDVVTLFTGNAFAQVVSLATAPVLARLYLPEQMGLYVVFLSLATSAASIACLRYDYALLIPSESRSAALLGSISIQICLAVSAVITLVSFPLSGKFVGEYLTENSGIVVALIGTYVAILGITNVLNMMATRIGRVNYSRDSRIISVGLVAATQIVLGLSAPTVVSLVVGALLGAGVNLLVFAARGRPSLIAHCRSNASMSGRLEMAREYRKFPLINMWSALVDVLKYNGINLAIGGAYGLWAVGQYGQAWRFVVAPAILVSGSLSAVLYRHMARVPREDLYRSVRRAAALLTLLGAAIFVPFMVASPRVFPWLLGQTWEPAGWMAQGLCLWLWASLVAGPLSHVFLVIGRQGLLLCFSLIQAVAPIGAILVGHRMGLSAQAGVWCLSLVLSLAAGAAVVAALRMAAKVEPTETQPSPAPGPPRTPGRSA